ncbi:NUDIX domain-containing protein [Halorubrum halodurans]|jgi:ADP-ribose pyrophosphatase YjhB (NUDIX family)|uniref:ADP-ribose pyrophosphatase n=1 Tax=Halorubrum halodurans TaxID=1383851 RepID=A0A256IIX2_9EURY|nr:NUDIX domain-containing protein [Halorubrum halodurans]OYR56518.1 ADP-ribose pyrophosphatase [Halorubrum halodurans]
MTDTLHCATVSVRGVVTGPRGRTLLLQRATDEEWELPGGRLETDEDTVSGLRREITEETDLSVEIGDILAADSWVNESGRDRFAVHYACFTAERTVDISTEHVDWAWVEPRRTPSFLCERQTAAVRTAIDGARSPRRNVHASAWE